MKKVCVYAICKNEIKFVERWFNTIKNADYICVLDTGSTDGTYERLKELESQFPNYMKVEQKEIKPWRFDVARNESMKLIPEDTDICVSIDFDDVFPNDWKEIIIEDIEKGYNKIIGNYQYYEGDTPTSVIKLDRISLYGEAHWENGIHERLVCDNENAIIDDRFLVEHRQDLTKERRTVYLEAAINSYDENNFYSMMCLGYELYNIGNFSESIAVFTRLYEKVKGTNSEFLTRKWMLVVAEMYKQLNEEYNQSVWLELALEINNSDSPFEDYNCYNGQIEDKLALYYYYNGDYIKAYKYGKIAFALCNNNERIANNLEYYKDKFQIIVYTICKNEIINLDNWIKPLLKADKIFVLDTGSNDGTWEKLEELSKEYNNVYVRRKCYDTFKFDVARNDSLDFAMEYVNNGVALFIDLDEYCSDNIIDEVINQWNNDYDTLELYCQNVDMFPTKGHKIDKSIKWHYHIHEKIAKNNFETTIILRLKNAYYNHYQDLSKDRSYYGKLKVAHSEEPNCIHYLTYLVWEAQLHNELYKAEEYALNSISLIWTNKDDEHYKDVQYLIYCLLNIPFNKYKELIYDNIFKIETMIANNECQDFKFIHLFEYKVYDYFKEYTKSDLALIRAIKGKDINSWIKSNFKTEDDDIYFNLMMNAFYNLKDYGKAYYYAKLLYNSNNSETNEYNVRACQEKYLEELKNGK